MDPSPSKLLTVLMTTDTVGGVWNYCMELCRALGSTVQVHLVTAGAPLLPAQVKEAAALPHIVLYETAYKLEWMQEPWADIDASGAWLLQLEQQVRPDIIHLNSYAYAALPFRAPKIVVAHSDVCTWWHAVKGEAPGPEWNEYFRRVKAGLDAADVVVGITRAALVQMQQIYGFDTETRIIYNGRDAAHFFTQTKQPEVMAMGRLWDEAKNTRLLLEAAPHVQCRIKIAGDLSFAENESQVTSNVVHYLGHLDTEGVARELSTASVFVLPALYEPFGLSPLEAALSGCALVLSALPTLQEVWGDAALYVEPDDAISMACVVNELVSHPVLRDAMAAKAAGCARRFTTGAMASHYEELYRSLCSEQRAMIQQKH